MWTTRYDTCKTLISVDHRFAHEQVLVWLDSAQHALLAARMPYAVSFLTLSFLCRSGSGTLELAPWLVSGANRVIVMHISTTCRDASLSAQPPRPNRLHTQRGHHVTALWCAVCTEAPLCHSDTLS